MYGPVAWSEFPRTRLDDAGNRICRPATRYAIEPTAQISRRPQAHDAVAGPGVRRVARKVQENSLQAAGPPCAADTAAQAGVEWRSILRSPMAIMAPPIDRATTAG